MKSEPFDGRNVPFGKYSIDRYEGDPPFLFLFPLAIERMETLFKTFWAMRKDECPLCKRKIKFKNVPNHLGGTFCPNMIRNLPEERIQVFQTFQNCRIINRKVSNPRQLCPEEKMVSGITTILGFRRQPRLEWECQFEDGQISWITNSKFVLSWYKTQLSF